VGQRLLLALSGHGSFELAARQSGIELSQMPAAQMPLAVPAVRFSWGPHLPTTGVLYHSKDEDHSRGCLPRNSHGTELLALRKSTSTTLPSLNETVAGCMPPYAPMLFLLFT
jgi:hypothetical protein